MNRKIRTTLVTLMPKGTKAEDTPGFIDKIIAGEDPTMLRTIYKTMELPGVGQRSYVKISKVLKEDEINDEWYHRITERLRDAGCTDVAWRVTIISPDDCEPENTTASFPMDLFKNCLVTDDMAIDLPKTPMEPFGSDAFWERFDSDTE